MSEVELTMQSENGGTAVGFDPMAALHRAIENNNGDALSSIGTQSVQADVTVGSVNTDSISVNVPEYDGDGVQESLDKMFAAVIAGGLDPKVPDERQLMVKKADVFKQAVNRFLSTFRDNIFADEYAVLYSALSTLNIKIFSYNQLDIILEHSADDILNSGRINLDKYTYLTNGSLATDDEKLMAFKYDVKDKFETLSKMYVTIEQFESACQIYKLYYKDKAMTEITQSMAMIMTDGLHEKVGKGRNRLWKGVEDCQEYYSLKVSILNALDSKEEESDFIVDEDWLSDELEAEKAGEAEMLLDTGIKEIDEVYGGFARGNMVEVMGPPKGGKTTFVQFLVERALRKGLNVAVWALEGTKEEWIASLVALIVKMDTGIVISKRRVLKKKYKDDREKQAVIAAKNELALNIKRGKLSFIGKACYVETMVNDLDNHWKNKNPFDVIAVDSPILAKSRKGKSSTEAAAEAYTTLKHYISYELVNKALALVTAQLKQTVIDDIRANPTAEIDVTAGGVTAETIRTPDFITCITSTKAERKQGQVRMNDVAARHSESFNSFYMGAELACSYFYSDPALNEI